MQCLRLAAPCWLVAFLIFVMPYSCVTATAASPSKGSKQPKHAQTAAQNVLRHMAASILLCRLSMELALAGGRALEKAYGCIDEAKTAIVPHYHRARDALASRPIPLTMLKDVYALWLTMMGSILPGREESMFAYKTRLDRLEARFREMRHRLEIEVE